MGINSPRLQGDYAKHTGLSWGSANKREFNSPQICLAFIDNLKHFQTFGLRTLSPRRLQKLLEDCRSIKVKRLFLWFAERHHFRWKPQINEDRIDLGKGKRMLARGGRLDAKYLITVPEDLDGGQ